MWFDDILSHGVLSKKEILGYESLWYWVRNYESRYLSRTAVINWLQHIFFILDNIYQYVKTVRYKNDGASQILRCLSDLQSRKLSPSFARKAAIFLSCRSEGVFKKLRGQILKIFNISFCVPFYIIKLIKWQKKVKKFVNFSWKAKRFLWKKIMFFRPHHSSFIYKVSKFRLSNFYKEKNMLFRPTHSFFIFNRDIKISFE